MILDLLRHASTGRPGHLDGRTDPPLIDGAPRQGQWVDIEV